MELRTQIEKAYYNTRLSKISENLEVYGGLYGSQAARSSLRRGYIFLEKYLYTKCPGKQVLDFGRGIHSISMAKMGAFVTGIDISDVSIKIARMFAERKSIGDRCNFIVGNVEEMRFGDDSFDIVFSSGMMSYLNLNRAFSEICRVLKPDGMFLGIDTLGHNPILNLSRYLKYRRGERTINTLNRILHMSDLEKFLKYFGKVEFKYFDLMTFLAIPLERIPNIHLQTLRLLEDIDNYIFHFALKRYAFKVVFLCSQPPKHLYATPKKVKVK